MIYLTEGNIPLNAAYDDDIVQEANSTYQLTFKFPTNNILWQRLREETFLTADDLHGEQDFVIFEIEKKHGHIQVYANQVMTMLNHYVVNPISLDRVSGSAALSSFAGSITRDNPFSFFSDIDDRHTFNIDSKNAMEALTKDKHSILGLWGGDLVRHGYQVRLLKNGGSENESLFMYKKNLSSYEHKTSTKSLRTRITFITTIRGEGENPVDKHYKVVVDSPLINKYSQIYEDVVEVSDQDVKDEASLREYGKQYFRTSLCDLMEDNIEIDVVGHSDVPVQMFDVVSVYHEYYDLDVRKKITKYNYSPMSKKLKSIGFGQFQSGLASAIGNAVSDAVKSETQHLDGIFEAKLAKEIQNADLAFDRKKEELTNQFTDEVNAIKAKAEENKRALSDEIDQRLHDFSPEGFDEAKAKAEEALRKVGASSALAEEAKYIADQNSVIFAGLADKVNKQNDKLGDTITDLKRYAREESASQARAVREDVTRDFVGKSTYLENVQGVERRLESLSLGTSGNLLKNSNDGFYNQHDKRYRLVETLQANQTYTLVTKYWHGENSTGHTFFNGIDWVGLNYNQAIDAWMVQFTPRQEIPAGTETILSSHPGNAKGNMSWATLVRGAIPLIHWQPAKGDVEQKLAEYKETVDGRFATISTQINGKVNQSDFQRVKETSQLYERLLGTNDSNVSTNIARMALTSELFEVEVGKRFSNLTNLFYAPTKIPKYISSVATDTHLSRVGWSDHHGIRINYTDSMSGWLGVCFPLTKKFVKQGESLGYRIEIAVDKVPRDGRVLIQLWDNTSNLNMYCNYPIPLTKTGGQVFTGYLDIPSTGELNEYSLRFVLTSPGNIVIHKPMIVDKRIIPNEFIDSTDYNNEYNRTTMSLLQDSFAIKTLTSAGAIASQINTNANNILIEANKIRLKGSTLADEITAIDGRFKRLLVGEGNFATLNTDVLRSNSISGDKLAIDQALINKLVASDVFTNTLSAKNAFINRLRSTIVSATLLEGYKGKIGGFQIGTHEKDPNVYWLTGQNQFDVGMSNGSSRWDQTALWVNWGNNWGVPGDGAWFVKRTGEMYCKNTAHFYNTPVVHGNLRVGGNIYFINDNDKTGGYWIYSPAFKQINKDKGYLYFYDFNNQPTDWIPLNKEISDRRFKTNIKDSQVSGLDVIESLKTYSYRKEYDEKIEDISCGIMAQDVQKYAPEAFYENPDGAYSYNTFALVPYLIKAIQELNQKLEEVNARRN